MRQMLAAFIAAAVVWFVITAAGVLSYVYVGLRCTDGLACLKW